MRSVCASLGVLVVVVGCSSEGSQAGPGDAPDQPPPDGGTSDASRVERSPRAPDGASPADPDCDPERKRCDGRCVDADDPLYGCSRASCGAPCDLPHAAARCSRGECAIESCEQGYLDCDGDATNGCEAKTPSCTACARGRADCDGNLANGCETDIENDLMACGACGSVCAGAHALATCSSGRCVLDCLPEYLDCDGDATNGCETHADADALACGACGHACQGLACADGRCAAAPLTATAGRVVEVVADATHLYWTESGRAGLFTADRDGRSPRALVAQGGGASGLALDDTHVFWLDPAAGALMRAGKDGAQPRAIVSGVGGGGFIAVGPRHVYFTLRAAGAVWMANKDGAAAHAIATGLAEPMGIAADASGAYWVTAGGAPKIGNVMAAAPDGTGVRTLVRGQRWASAIAVDASHVYWTTRADRAVMRAPKSGAAIVQMMAGLVDPQALVVDGGYVYVADGGQGVFRLPATGGASLRLFAGEVEPRALAVQGAWAIFADATAAPAFGLAQVAK